MKKKKAKKRKSPALSSIFTNSGKLRKTTNWPVRKIKARVVDKGRGKPLPTDDRVDIDLSPNWGKII
jgi:hypothetical protein